MDPVAVRRDWAYTSRLMDEQGATVRGGGGALHRVRVRGMTARLTWCAGEMSRGSHTTSDYFANVRTRNIRHFRGFVNGGDGRVCPILQAAIGPAASMRS
ncbi:hypothetical protein BKG68_18330 [Mycobacteroides saopaulense]|uniref:Uncharacterized protein n=1 Tax=Mycobacteroides saopaulense TaxID=1578165 RepID=A0ABX3C0R1_9MYCO|nr:hypothetical protein BKG68_18330 [Mycobacteroides saopaulense]OHU10019.1 hypothetical protein BKG73_12995 [Mycobacteroides saopaulense]